MSIANELITRGWGRGNYEDAEGRVCLAGAARYSVGSADRLDFRHALVAVFAALPADARRGGTDQWHAIFIGNWNDAPERTFDEVLRVAKMADEILDGLA